MNKKAVPTVPALPRLCAKDDVEAANILGVSIKTIYRLTKLPAGNPRRIRRTTYGNIPFCELQRHIEAEMRAADERE